jgi:hypothetical protein
MGWSSYRARCLQRVTVVLYSNFVFYKVKVRLRRTLEKGNPPPRRISSLILPEDLMRHMRHLSNPIVAQ